MTSLQQINASINKSENNLGYWQDKLKLYQINGIKSGRKYINKKITNCQFNISMLQKLKLKLDK